MIARTPVEAVHAFFQPIQLALSTITRAVPDISGGYYVSAEPHALTLSKGAPVRLHGDSRISLTLVHYYRIVEDVSARGPWRVITTTYMYAFDDPDGHEIVAFHWHPGQRSTIAFPHLHLGSGAKIGHATLGKAHIPTGYVTIQDVIRFGIQELGVRPLRDDWDDILTQTQSAMTSVMY